MGLPFQIKHTLFQSPITFPPKTRPLAANQMVRWGPAQPVWASIKRALIAAVWIIQTSHWIQRTISLCGMSTGVCEVHIWLKEGGLTGWIHDKSSLSACIYLEHYLSLCGVFVSFFSVCHGADWWIAVLFFFLSLFFCLVLFSEAGLWMFFRPTAFTMLLFAPFNLFHWLTLHYYLQYGICFSVLKLKS